MKIIGIVIDTVRGSSQTYDYDLRTNFFKLVKILPVGMAFPHDVGFIPDTRGEDGYPLDVMVISEFNSFPGCMLSCRIIGALNPKQEEKEKKKKILNDRFIAIPVQSLLYERIKNVNDLPTLVMDELQQFFINYNKIAGKIFTPLGIINSKAARKLSPLTKVKCKAQQLKGLVFCDGKIIACSVNIKRTGYVIST